jgi:hypothetical protein
LPSVAPPGTMPPMPSPPTPSLTLVTSEPSRPPTWSRRCALASPLAKAPSSAWLMSSGYCILSVSFILGYEMMSALLIFIALRSWSE